MHGLHIRSMKSAQKGACKRYRWTGRQEPLVCVSTSRGPSHDCPLLLKLDSVCYDVAGPLKMNRNRDFVDIEDTELKATVVVKAFPFTGKVFAIAAKVTDDTALR